jgi:hypothetical protein
MERRWRARVLIGTAIVVALGAGGTAMAMASEPDGGGTGSAAGVSAGFEEAGGVTAPTPPSPDNDPYLRCLKANGAVVTTQTSADGRHSVTVTLEPAKRARARAACQRYAPAGLDGPGGPGGRALAITPLTAAQAATVTKCLRAAGVAYPAAGVTQTLGVPPAGPTAAGLSTAGLSTAGLSTADRGPASGGSVIAATTAGGGPAVAAPAPPDRKVVTALGQCARAAGLPGLALATQSAHGSTTAVVAAGTARRL